MPKLLHFLTLKDFSAHEIQNLVFKSIQIKNNLKRLEPFLRQKTLALIFQKRSTRTRVSCESGWALYGGYPLFLGQNDIQSAESLSVTSKVVSSMTDCIIARMNSHSDLIELAKNSTVPVINALTDQFHPLQILADLATIQEIYGAEKIKIAWVGDSNNILNSMLLTYPRLGYHLQVCTPKEYPVNKSFIPKGAHVFLTHKPEEACSDADVIMTDTWISMGENKKNIKSFDGFQVNEQLGKVSKSDWKFMHCLPRYSHEVDDEGSQAYCNNM